MTYFSGKKPRRSILKFHKELPKEVLEYSPLILKINKDNLTLKLLNEDHTFIIGENKHFKREDRDNLELLHREYFLEGKTSYRRTGDQSIIVTSINPLKALDEATQYKPNAINNIRVFLGGLIEVPHTECLTLEGMCSLTNIPKPIIQGAIEVLKKNQIIFPSLYQNQ